MVAAKQSSPTLRLEQPLRGASIAYDGKPKVARASHEAEVKASYKSGYDDASSQYNQQILDFRAEINALREGTFSQLENQFQKLVVEAREALMTLTHQCVARALGGYELPAEAIAQIVDTMVVESGLDEERVEVRLRSEDIALLVDLEKELKTKHPGLEFVADDGLKRGDCLLTSRFGKIDGLMDTKLKKLEESLRPS